MLNSSGVIVSEGVEKIPEGATSPVEIYERLAFHYDKRYDTPQAHRENALIAGLLRYEHGSFASSQVMDLGAGTGLALDLGLGISPRRYLAVEPSPNMSGELRRKHPGARWLYQSTAEEFMKHRHSHASHQVNDVVLSLFGSPSYMAPETIERLPEFSRNLIVLMHYAPGYLPDYHTPDTAPKQAEESLEAALGLLDLNPGYSFRFADFQVTVVTL